MKQFKEFLKNLPPWARYVFIGLAVVATAVYLLCSCSSVRAVVHGDGSLSTSVSQSVADSMKISVYLNQK